MDRLIVLLMAGGLVLGGMQTSWAQPAPPPPPRLLAQVQPMTLGQPVPTVSGTVQQYLLTPHGENDATAPGPVAETLLGQLLAEP